MKEGYVTLNENYRDQNVMILSLNNIGTLNAIDIEMLEALKEKLSFLSKMSDIKVLIVKSNTPKAFSTGVNTSYVSSLSNENAAMFFAKIAAVLKTIEHLPFITIAAISGYAYGAGADLALSCDIRIGKSNSKFRFPGPQFGLILGTHRLIHEVGRSKARFLTLTNKVVESNEALQYGLLHQIIDDNLFEKVLIKAKRLTQIPNHSLKNIKYLTNTNEKKEENVEMTKESVLESNFSKTFNVFLNSSKKQKEG